jgi:DNA-binding IclR family transcriptional regulator
MTSFLAPHGRDMKTRKPPRVLTRGNSTILIGADLLGVVAGFKGPAPLTSIAAAANMSPSRAYRYLRGLCDSGLLEQTQPSGLYDLGPRILDLGLAAINRMDPVMQATAIMPELTDEVGLVSIITVWGTHGPTAIRCEQGNLAAPVRTREGAVLPMLHTAAGKIFLAYMPPAVTDPMVAREIAEWNAHNTEKDFLSPDSAAAIRDEVRKRGVARALGTYNPLLASLAAPIFNRDGGLELSLTVTGVKGSFDSSTKGPVARRLLDAAQAVSRKLGYKDDG